LLVLGGRNSGDGGRSGLAEVFERARVLIAASYLSLAGFESCPRGLLAHLLFQSLLARLQHADRIAEMFANVAFAQAPVDESQHRNQDAEQHGRDAGHGDVQIGLNQFRTHACELCTREGRHANPAVQNERAGDHIRSGRAATFDRASSR
jgi:hypothetical protein